MTEYRLVVGVLGIIFDEDSEAEAKRQFDVFVQNPKTHDPRMPERQLRCSRITKSYGNITLRRFNGFRTGIPADLRTSKIVRICAEAGGLCKQHCYGLTGEPCWRLVPEI